MDITPRRIEQLRAEGVEIEKISDKRNEIFKNLSDEGYTLYEVETLIVMLGSRLEKMKKREPKTKISEIIYQPQ